MRLLSTLLWILPLLLPVRAHGQEAGPVTVRVLTYNIHHGQGTDRRFDLVRLAEVIKSVQPDLIALQEVDQGTERASGVDQMDELARLLGMHAEFGKAMDYMGGDYGVAVLSRWPLLSPDNQPLPGSLEGEPRTALTVHVRAGLDGPLLRFTSTHFDNRNTEDRLAQAAYLNDLLGTSTGQPSILAGDFNARPDTEVMAVLEAHWTNGATFIAPPPDPAPQQGRRGPRGDHVLFRPAEGWRVIESRIIDETVASDHRPVLTVLEWIGGT